MMDEKHMDSLQTAVMTVVALAVSDGYKACENGAKPETVLRDILTERTFLAMDILVAVATGVAIVSLEEEASEDEDRTIN